MRSVVQTLLCIIGTGAAFYLYIDKTNELTELRLALPQLTKEIRQIEEENSRLSYELHQFESPIHLMELARSPEFGHFKYPNINEVIVLEKQQ